MKQVLTHWAVSALLFVLLMMCCVDPTAAHQTNTSYANLSVDDRTITLVLAMDDGDLLLLFGETMDANGDGELWADEMVAEAEASQAWLAQRVRLLADGAPVAPSLGHPRVEADGDGNLFLKVALQVVLEAEPVSAQVDLSQLLQPPLLSVHRNLLKVVIPGQPEALVVLSAEQPRHEVRLREEATGFWTQAGRFVWLGVEHIWIGYDHILFLLALIVVGQRLGPLVKIVTAFTIAHSITLVLATLGWVILPSRLVEAGIALSIVYVAADNFWLGDGRYRWLLTFCFGFVHGFGFANVLRELGLPSEGLLASLLAFNVGVEAGQITIVAVLFPFILWLSRQSFHRRAVQLISAAILLFGLGWLVERVFDLSYMPL